MKLPLAAVLTICIVFLKGSAAAYISNPEDPKCERLYNYATRYIEVVKKELPSYYKQIEMSVRVLLKIDINDKETLKTIMCKAANARTLRDLYNIAPIGSYDQFVNMYRTSKNIVISYGGYTNSRRLLGIAHDMKDWVKSLNVGDVAEIKNSHDMSDIVQFFEVMQVKYGSRWLSLLVLAPNQDLLIEDPKQFGQNFYNSTSASDFQQRTGIEQSYAESIWNYVKHKGDYGVSSNLFSRQYTDLVVEGENLAGELGLYNLKY